MSNREPGARGDERRRRVLQPASLAGCISVSLAVWTAISLVAGPGWRVTAVTLGLCCVLFGVGLTLLRILGPARISPELQLLALPTGLTAVAAAAQIASHLGVPLILIFWGALLLSLPGIWRVRRQLIASLGAKVPLGGYLAILAAFVGVFYFGPIALTNGVETPEGGVRWTDNDSSFHQAIVEVVSLETGPVRNPLFAPQPIAYHYGRHALAAVLERSLALSAADALFRVVRPLGLCAVISLLIAFGRLTALRTEDKESSSVMTFLSFFVFGGIHTVFFLLPPTGTLFDALITHLPRPDGYKTHLMIGSGLWASVALLLPVAIFLAGDARKERGVRRVAMTALLLAVLGSCLNVVAGISGAGVVVGTYLMSHRRKRYAYLDAALALFVLIAVLSASGILQAETPSPLIFGSINRPQAPSIFANKLMGLFSYLTVGLLLKHVAFLTFLWGSWKARTTLAFFFCGFVLSHLTLHYPASGSNPYSLMFLTIVASAYAGAPAARILSNVLSPEERGLEMSKRSLGKLIGYLCSISIALGFGALAARLAAGFGVKGNLFVVAVTAACLAILAFRALPQAIPRRLHRFAGTALVLALVLSALSWLQPVMTWGFGLGGHAVALDGPRALSLETLRLRSSPTSLVATRRHDTPGMTVEGRSAMYSAIAGRYMLLEGWKYHFVSFHPSFPEISEKNDRLFSTPDPQEALSIARRHGVTHLVVEPGQSLGFDPATAPWLRRIDDPGCLELWEITP